MAGIILHFCAAGNISGTFDQGCKWIQQMFCSQFHSALTALTITVKSVLNEIYRVMKNAIHFVLKSCNTMTNCRFFIQNWFVILLNHKLQAHERFYRHHLIDCLRHWADFLVSIFILFNVYLENIARIANTVFAFPYAFAFAFVFVFVFVFVLDKVIKSSKHTAIRIGCQ